MASWSLSFLMGKAEFRIPALIASRCCREPQDTQLASTLGSCPVSEAGSEEGKDCSGGCVPRCCRGSPAASLFSHWGMYLFIPAHVHLTHSPTPHGVSLTRLPPWGPFWGTSGVSLSVRAENLPAAVGTHSALGRMAGQMVVWVGLAPRSPGSQTCLHHSELVLTA